MTMAHFDAGLVWAAVVNVWNLKTGEITEIKVDDYFGTKVHVDTSKLGDEIYSSIFTDELKMRFFKLRGKNAKIDISSKDFEGYFHANFEGQEGISSFTQYTEDQSWFGVDFKAASILIDNGKLSHKGKLLFECTKLKPCVGQLDQARRVIPFWNYGWFWACLNVISDGVRVGYNAGFSGDETDTLNDFTDDVLFLDGKLHKLDATIVEKVDSKTWKLKTSTIEPKFKKTKVELTFTVEDIHALQDNFVILKMDFKTNFGKVSGFVEHEGRRINIKDEFMIVEEMNALW